MVSGNPNIRNDSQEGYDAEILAVKILEKNGFEIIYAPELEKRTPNPDFLSLKELVELQHKLEKYGYGVYHAEKKKIYTMRDKEILKKFKDVKMNKLQEQKLQNLINKWKSNNTKLESQYAKENEIKNLLKQLIGKSIMPEINKKEWTEVAQRVKIESFKEYYLNKLKNDELFENTFVDVFCKKGGMHYIFDVKHKTFKENTNLNRFYVTNYEVLNYNKIKNKKKLKLKIMIFVEKGKKLMYKIFDWSDFLVPSSFNPNTKFKTSMRLKNGLDLQSFKTT